MTYYFGPRGAQRYDNVWRSDLSLLWSMNLIGRSEAFFRGLNTNVFNNSAQISGNETILTRAKPLGVISCSIRSRGHPFSASTTTLDPIT